MFMSIKAIDIFIPISLIYVLGAQKNRLIEKVLLSAQNICFWLSNKKNKKIITHFYDLKIYLRNKETQRSLQFIVNIKCNANRL